VTGVTEKLKNAFLASEVTESADVGEDESDAELIFGADGAEGEAAILEGDATAGAVVAELHELVLKEAAAEVVAKAEGGVPASAVELAVSNQGADLIRAGLENRVGLGGVLREGNKELAVRLHADEAAIGGDFAALGVVIHADLSVVAAAGSETEIADDGREVAAAIGEGEGSDGVERLKNIATAGEERAAKGAVEIDLLGQAPGKELFGLACAGAAEEALRDGVLHFVGIGERVVFIHAEKAAEAVYAVHEAIEDLRLDGVLPADGGAFPNASE